MLDAVLLVEAWPVEMRLTRFPTRSQPAQASFLLHQHLM